MFIKRQAQELRFMTQQKLHSVRSTGTATAILMSPDPPVLRAKVWLARLHQCSFIASLVAYQDIFNISLLLIVKFKVHPTVAHMQQTTITSFLGSTQSPSQKRLVINH